MSIDCLYFKALVPPASTVRFVALFRSIEDNYAFDRTECAAKGIFEFYVPFGFRDSFIKFITLFQEKGLVLEWWEEPINTSSMYVRKTDTFK